MEYGVISEQEHDLNSVLYKIKNTNKCKHLGVDISAKGGCDDKTNTGTITTNNMIR